MRGVVPYRRKDDEESGSGQFSFEGFLSLFSPTLAYGRLPQMDYGASRQVFAHPLQPAMTSPLSATPFPRGPERKQMYSYVACEYRLHRLQRHGLA